MNTESNEHLSSFMDGEFSEETGRFLVRRLGADDGLRQTWARYHLIRDCLRNQDGQFARKGLSHGVQLALSGEAQLSAGRATSPAWLKPLFGVALAASVALFAVLTVSQGTKPQTNSEVTGLAEAASAESFASPNILNVGPLSQPVNLSGRTAPDNQKMNTYLLRHYQVSGEAGGRGFVSFVPIVAAPSQARLVLTSGSKVQGKAEGDSIQR
jgi:sigma-E factor negative regulatory protein RseA